MGDDYCAVCAENLEWTAYAQCGHTETCSKCVARLRFVLDDTRCVVCQQSDSAVVVTRYAGEYTNKLPASDFATLKVKRLCMASSCHSYRQSPCKHSLLPKACMLPAAVLSIVLHLYNSNQTRLNSSCVRRRVQRTASSGICLR